VDVLSGGSVGLREYDPRWPARFRALAERAKGVLGGVAVAIEHVGSTAVPGMPAKPVIDLDVVVRAGDVPEAIRRLGTLGYVHRGNQGIEGRESFRPPSGDEPHHLYVCVPDSRGFRDHVVFRDHLRAHPGAALRYADLKRALAERYRDDRAAYQSAKGGFIDSITRQAERESAGPTPPP
jgi:GrpB-like predicted nucleotidyltransferase (UPF0157 family)